MADAERLRLYGYITSPEADDYLADHGNLLLSPREVRVSSIAEYQSQPARYTVSALGARLHREVEAFLSVTGGAREVPPDHWNILADLPCGPRHIDPTESRSGREPRHRPGAHKPADW